MQQIAPGIYYEDLYAGVTLGAMILPHGTMMVGSSKSRGCSILAIYAQQSLNWFE
jgi:hypothetical protein